MPHGIAFTDETAISRILYKEHCFVLFYVCFNVNPEEFLNVLKGSGSNLGLVLGSNP